LPRFAHPIRGRVLRLSPDGLLFSKHFSASSIFGERASMAYPLSGLGVFYAGE
jgi:hypothetical protein